MAAKDSSVVNYEKIKALLVDKKFKKVLSELRKPSNSDSLLNSNLDLISDIGLYLIGDDVTEEAVKFCQDAFQVLAKIGSCKELLMGFLEQLECLRSDVKFQVLLVPIQITLLRISSKRCQSLQWVLNTIQENVQSLPVPKSYGFVGKERLLMYLDPDVIAISNAVECIIGFYKPFVKEASLWFPGQVEDVQRRILVHFILKLFGTPLAFVDLNQVAGASKSRKRNLTETLVATLCNLESNFYSFYMLMLRTENESTSEKDENKIGIPTLALASFMYLVHAEEVHKDYLPCVYSHEYTFEINLPLICCLLSQSNEFAVHKGLLLTNRLLQFVTVQSLSDRMLDLEDCLTFVLRLIGIMSNSTWQYVMHFRKTARTIFFKYIEKFDYPCRYKIVFKLFNCVKHAGVEGLLIHIYKNNVIETLQQVPPLSLFVGSRLEKFLRLVLVLHQGVETDLLEECDRILNTLNFVRFLLLRDEPDANVTGVWNLVDFMEESFLKQLQIALDLSRNHYQLELNNMKEKGINTPVLSSASNSPMPNFPPNRKRDILLSSITGLDLIQRCIPNASLYKCYATESHTKPNNSSSDSDEEEPSNDFHESEKRIAEEKEKILNAALTFVPQLGWNQQSIAAGAQSIGFSKIAHGMFPREGFDLVNHFYIKCNERLDDILSKEALPRDSRRTAAAKFVQHALEQRLRMLLPHIENWYQAMSLMVIPANIPDATKNLYTMVDDVCFYAGDRSANFSWYTKRAGVAVTYAATELVLIQDKSDGFADTWTFLNKRICQLSEADKFCKQTEAVLTGMPGFAESAMLIARNILGLRSACSGRIRQ